MTQKAKVGRVLRVLGGFYRVILPDGSVEECRLAGKLKGGAGARGIGPVLPGDYVHIQLTGSINVITAIASRRNELVRPAVANVDTCVLVQSFTQPDPIYELMEKVLIQACAQGITPIICWTKADLVDFKQQELQITPFTKYGYLCISTSVVSGIGLQLLKETLVERVSILAGISGVGKSSLLNALCTHAKQDTNPLSARIQRGKHTTRHVELLPLSSGGWLADSPGFSAVDLSHIDVIQLGRCYPDYLTLAPNCRFANCRHQNEPECAIKQAVASGELDAARYSRYLQYLEEVETNAARRY